MSLTTYRVNVPYKNGLLAIDKCEYLGEVDYELEYEATSYEQGKREFVEIVNEFGVKYKKSEAKIKRAYAALRKKSNSLINKRKRRELPLLFFSFHPFSFLYYYRYQKI